jgi:hypothetical protein
VRVALFLIAACAVLAHAQQAITVLEPNGGETYSPGDTMHVRWEADTMPVLVEVSVDQGETWYVILTGVSISPSSPHWGDYAWIVTDSLRELDVAVSTVSSACLIRVRDYRGFGGEDVSDSVFSVVPGAGAVRLPATAIRNQVQSRLRVHCTAAGRVVHSPLVGGVRVRLCRQGRGVVELMPVRAMDD